MKSKQIGVLLGREYSFPEAFPFRGAELVVNHNIAEKNLVMAKEIDPFGNISSIDRISSETAFQRPSIRNRAACGTLVVNSSPYYGVEEAEPRGPGPKNLIDCDFIHILSNKHHNIYKNDAKRSL